MSKAKRDVIDLLVGIQKGSRLDLVRSQRPEARENAQKSYLALFAPASVGDVTGEERFAVATFVAGLHEDEGVLSFYGDGLMEQDHRQGLIDAINDEFTRAAARGPYGHYPKGPLSAEDKPGPTYVVSSANRDILGTRLAAAFEHAHMLVFHPRDASPDALQLLLNAGWSTTDIVTLSQLVAFLSFQIRVIIGLRALAAAATDKA